MQYTRIGNEYSEDDEIGRAIDKGMGLMSTTESANGFVNEDLFLYESNYRFVDGEIHISISLTDNTRAFGFMAYKEAELELVEWDPARRPTQNEAEQIATDINDGSEAEALEQYNENDDIEKQLMDSKAHILMLLAGTRFNVQNGQEMTDEQRIRILKHLQFDVQYTPAQVLDSEDVLNYWDEHFTE